MANNLEKRILGESGLKVSRLSFGTLSFSVYHANLTKEKAAELLIKGYNSGINFWDTAELYETYVHISLALEKLGYPDDIVISSRSYVDTYDEMKFAVETCLKKLKKDSVEIFGFHEVQVDEFDGQKFRNGATDALVEAKQKGLIKAISLTTHSAKVAQLASNVDDIDIIMPLINHKGIGIKDGTLEDMEAAIKEAKQKGKGVYAMKALAGGCFANDVKTALNYVIDNQSIDSIAIGMDCDEELIFNFSLFCKSEEFSHLEEKLKAKKRFLKIEPWCVGCENCIKICPQGAIELQFGQAKIDHSKCVRCGYCVSACKDFFIKFLNDKEL